MAKKVRIKPAERVGLRLTRAQRRCLLELDILDGGLKERIRQTPLAEPAVPFSLDELDDLAGYVAAHANHTSDRELEQRLDRIYDRICFLEDRLTEE